MKPFQRTKNIFIIGFVTVFYIFNMPSLCMAEDVKNLPKKKSIDCKDQSIKSISIDCYLMELASIIQKNWIVGDEITNLDGRLEATILVKILKDGQLGQFKFESRSGNSLLDQSAMNAITRSVPFPRLPDDMTSYDLGLIFTPKGLK